MMPLELLPRNSMKNKKQAGVTLVETLLYAVFFALMIGFAMFSFNQILEANLKHQNRLEVEIEANFIMQKILWALSDAQTINEPAVNTTSSILSVTKYNFAQNSLVFDLDSENIRLRRGAGDLPGPAIILNSNTVRITNLSFYRSPEIGNQPEAIAITLSVAALPQPIGPTASTTLTTKIYLKK